MILKFYYIIDESVSWRGGRELPVLFLVLLSISLRLLLGWLVLSGLLLHSLLILSLCSSLASSGMVMLHSFRLMD